MIKNGDFYMKITVKIAKITFAKIEVFSCISVILNKKAVKVVLPLKQGLKHNFKATSRSLFIG